MVELWVGCEGRVIAMRRLLIVRHGESTANRDRKVLGWSLAVPLTERGRAQALAAAERLALLVGGQQVRLLSSDALRASQTGQIIADRLGVELAVTALLREQCLGDLEGRPVSQLRALPVPVGSDISEVAWGGGETIAEVHTRMSELLGSLRVAGATAAPIVLVGHGDSLRVLETVLAGRGHREVDWDGPGLSNGEVRELTWRSAS